jgi:hypothetical protein
MNVTLCNKKYNGNIPMYDFDNKEEARELITYWLENKDFENSVFVCFQNFRNTPDEYLRNEQIAILVSHDLDSIDFFIDDNFQCNSIEKIDFAIFEFESYKEAFLYCIDLKEGF